MFKKITDILNKGKSKKHIVLKKEDNDKNVDDLQLNLSTNKAQKRNLKNIKLDALNDLLTEKQKIQFEKQRLQKVIFEINSEIEKTKLLKQKSLEDVNKKQQILLEQTEQQKRIDLEKIRKKEELLKLHQKNISYVNQEHVQKVKLLKENVKKKEIDAKGQIKLNALAIKQELYSKKRELQSKFIDNKQLAIDLKQKIKNEKQETKLKKLEETRKFKKEIAQMKLELFSEKQLHKANLEAKRDQVKSLVLVEINFVKKEFEKLKAEKKAAKEELKKLAIKSSIEFEKIKSKEDIEFKQEQINLNQLKFDNKIQLDNIKEKNIQEIENIQKENDTLIQKDIKISSVNIEVVDENKMLPKLENDESFVTYLSEFKNFDKKGIVVLNKTKKPVSDKSLKKFLKHPYYGLMVENYMNVKREQNFSNLLNIIIAAHIMSSESINKELMNSKVETLQKAILQGIIIKIGKYFIVPIRKNSIQSFSIETKIESGKIVFDNLKIFTKNVIYNLEKIVDYKLMHGASIKIIEGLGIVNADSSLSIALFPNILR